MRATQSLRLRQTSRMLMAMPKEQHRAHTVTQRLRQLKKIPVELIPLGAVLAAALGAAFWSMGHKLASDKTLRLWPKRDGGKEH